MPVVTGVFLDHVLVDPPQRRRLAGLRNEIVQATADHGRPRSFHAGPVDREVLICSLRIDIFEVRVRAVFGAVEHPFRLAIENVEPRFHLGSTSVALIWPKITRPSKTTPS